MSSLFLSLLAYDREDLMVAALAGLMVAGAVVAIGAWWLFFRETRRRASRGLPAGVEGARGRGATIEPPDRLKGSEPVEVSGDFRTGDPEP
jgi:hypothetical protein